MLFSSVLLISQAYRALLREAVGGEEVLQEHDVVLERRLDAEVRVAARRDALAVVPEPAVRPDRFTVFRKHTRGGRCSKKATSAPNSGAQSKSSPEEFQKASMVASFPA